MGYLQRTTVLTYRDVWSLCLRCIEAYQTLPPQSCVTPEEVISTHLAPYNATITVDVRDFIQEVVMGTLRFHGVCAATVDGYSTGLRRTIPHEEREALLFLSYLFLFRGKEVRLRIFKALLGRERSSAMRLNEFLLFLSSESAVRQHAVPLWQNLVDSNFIENTLLLSLQQNQGLILSVATFTEAGSRLMAWRARAGSTELNHRLPNPPGPLCASPKSFSGEDQLSAIDRSRHSATRLPPLEVREMIHTLPDNIPRFRLRPVAVTEISPVKKRHAKGFDNPVACTRSMAEHQHHSAAHVPQRSTSSSPPAALTQRSAQPPAAHLVPAAPASVSHAPELIPNPSLPLALPSHNKGGRLGDEIEGIEAEYRGSARGVGSIVVEVGKEKNSGRGEHYAELPRLSVTPALTLPLSPTGRHEGKPAVETIRIALQRIRNDVVVRGNAASLRKEAAVYRLWEEQEERERKRMTCELSDNGEFQRWKKQVEAENLKQAQERLEARRAACVETDVRAREAVTGLQIRKHEEYVDQRKAALRQQEENDAEHLRRLEDFRQRVELIHLEQAAVAEAVFAVQKQKAEHAAAQRVAARQTKKEQMVVQKEQQRLRASLSAQLRAELKDAAARRREPTADADVTVRGMSVKALREALGKLKVERKASEKAKRHELSLQQQQRRQQLQKLEDDVEEQRRRVRARKAAEKAMELKRDVEVAQQEEAPTEQRVLGLHQRLVARRKEQLGWRFRRQQQEIDDVALLQQRQLDELQRDKRKWADLQRSAEKVILRSQNDGTRERRNRECRFQV